MQLPGWVVAILLLVAAVFVGREVYRYGQESGRAQQSAETTADNTAPQTTPDPIETEEQPEAQDAWVEVSVGQKEVEEGTPEKAVEFIPVPPAKTKTKYQPVTIVR